MICGVEGSAVRRTYPTYAVRIAQVLCPFTAIQDAPRTKSQSQEVESIVSHPLKNRKGWGSRI